MSRGDEIASGRPYSVGFWSALAKLLGLRRFIGAANRKSLMRLMLLMVLGAAAEMVTVASVVPFLALITEDPATSSGIKLEWLFALIGEPFPIRMALLFGIVALTSGAIRLLLLWYSVRVTLDIGHALADGYYHTVLQQPYRFHVETNSSEVLAGLQKVHYIITAALLPFIQGVVAVGMAIALCATLIAINPVISLWGIGFAALFFLMIAGLTQRRLSDNSIAAARLEAYRIRTAQEGLGSIRDIILDKSQDKFSKQFRQLDRELMDRRIENQFISSSPRLVLEAVAMMGIAVVAVVMLGSGVPLSGYIPVIGAMALGVQRLLPMIQQIYFGRGQLIAAHQHIDDVAKVLALESAIVPQTDNRKLRFEKTLRFDNVSFRYAEGLPLALEDISFEIPKGNRIGLVGSTGSGKSTVADLLMGLIEPSEGRILVDDVPLDPSNRDNWRANISHVPQAIFLLDTSLAQNIALSERGETVKQDRLLEAASMARVDHFIDTLEAGYDTHVGERGVRLSGGQRQRIGLARALYRRTTVLVLDEATSALDEAMERAVMASIDSIDRQVTLFIVAHRLSTLSNCDIILQFENGRLARKGPPAEMLPLLSAYGSLTEPHPVEVM